MLRDILIGISADTGLSLEDQETKAMLVFKVNELAQELHESTDLVNSLDELLLWYDPAEKQVALPYLVDELRGIAWYLGPEKITMNDMRPLYGNNMDMYTQCLNWRDKYEHPFARPLINYSRLKFTLPAELDYDIPIKIIGRTEDSDRLIELVNFSHHTTEVECQSTWINVESIQKELITKYNISIFDVENNLLGVIPNIATECRYRIIQILDDSVQHNQLTTGVRVLFKKRFFPMINDEDVFSCGNLYDKMIQWKFLYEYWSKMETPTAQLKAANALQMVTLLTHQKEKNHNQGHDKPMEVKPQPMFGMFRRYYSRYSKSA